MNRKPFILAACVALAGLVSSAAAKPPPEGYESFRDYYSDPARTQLVGGQHWDCGGDLTFWGQSTSYSTYAVVPC